MVTPGSQQALFLTLLSTLDQGDEVLIPNPSYTIYSPIVKYLGARPVRFSLSKEHNFHIEAQALGEKVSDKTKIIILCSPNNPTGTVLNREDLEAIARVAIQNDLLVLSDEIYSEFVWEGRKHLSVPSYQDMKERTVVIVSFSKTFAMSGWRLGFLIANSSLVERMLRLQGNIVLCPSAFVQMAGIAALKGSWRPVKKMAQEYEKRINFMSERLDELEGISCLKPEGAFYIWADISEISESSRKFCEDLLMQKQVVAVAGRNFGSLGEGYIRLAMVKPIEDLCEAADRIESFIKG
jgi:aminotransferase